jgi:hypothetical protein
MQSESNYINTDGSVDLLDVDVQEAVKPVT